MEEGEERLEVVVGRDLGAPSDVFVPPTDLGNLEPAPLLHGPRAFGH